MEVPIGEMRQPAVLLSPVVTIDEAGGETVTYAESDFFYCAIRVVGSKEALAFGQINAEVSHICFGHYHDFKQVTSDMRLRDLDTNIEYDIAGPPMIGQHFDHARLNLLQRENG